MKKICQVIIVLTSVLSLSACANMRMTNIHPEWNPSNGQEEAEARCKAQSYAFTDNGIDILMHTPKKVYNGCMASYGYEQRKIINDSNAKHIDKNKVCK